MVRYTLAIRGKPKGRDSDFTFSSQAVDIFHEEQLSEHFLCDINPLGQVPVLTSPSLPKPITDSLKITHYLSNHYPSLIPISYKTQITRLLSDLHALNYFSLTFPGREGVADGLKIGAEKRLDGDISERYRKALHFKIEVLQRDKIDGLKPDVVDIMAQRAESLMQECASLLSDGGPWILGLHYPSALDAHLVVFLSRMRDVGRKELIPERLGTYLDDATKTWEWKETMEGRKTIISK